MKSIFIIGLGNMGGALIAGINNSKSMPSVEVFGFDTLPEKRDAAKKKWKIRIPENIEKGIINADLIVLAVKPVDFPALLAKLTSLVTPKQTIVSIAAGIRISKIKKAFDVGIARVMPNTPALIGAGMSAVAFNDKTTPEHKKDILILLRGLGEVIEVPEAQMDAVTGLSGSGPAYVFLFIESLIEGGIRAGLPADIAKKLAIQTVLGSTQLAGLSNRSLSALRQMVASPGGTTVAGLNILESKGFLGTVVSAIEAAAIRSKELSQ